MGAIKEGYEIREPYSGNEFSLVLSGIEQLGEVHTDIACSLGQVCTIAFGPSEGV